MKTSRRFYLIGVVLVAGIVGYVLSYAPKDLPNKPALKNKTIEQSLADKKAYELFMGDPRIHSDEIKENISRCSTDTNGEVYVALGKEVFRLPYQDLVYYDPRNRAKKQLPPAPDPDEPKGCPGNPLRGSTFYLFYTLRDQSNLPDQSLPSPRSLRFDITSPGTNGGQAMYLRMFPKWCASKEIDIYKSGLTACRLPSRDTKIREYWSTTYMVDPSIHRSPMGEAFAFFCGPFRPLKPLTGKPPLGMGGKCRIRYKFYPTVKFGYQFKITAMPMTNFIEYDKRIQSEIKSRHIEAFQWGVKMETQIPSAKEAKQ